MVVCVLLRRVSVLHLLEESVYLLITSKILRNTGESRQGSKGGVKSISEESNKEPELSPRVKIGKKGQAMAWSSPHEMLLH